MEVMHECNVHNFPLDLAPIEAIERGIIRVGGLRGSHSTIVTSLEMFQKTIEGSIVGDNVGILFGDVQRKNTQHGMIIVKLYYFCFELLQKCRRVNHF